MKKLLFIIAMMFSFSVFANGNGENEHKEHHKHEQHQPSKPDIPSPRPPTASKAPANVPEAKTNTEGSRDVCNRWIKPLYCLEKLNDTIN